MFGPHLILDCYKCSSSAINDLETVAKFLKETPVKIGLRPLTEPMVWKFKDVSRWDKGGISGWIIISESHISVHTFVKQRFAVIDVVSCVEFDVEKTVEIVKETFKPKEIKSRLIDRGTVFKRY